MFIISASVAGTTYHKAVADQPYTPIVSNDNSLYIRAMSISFPQRLLGNRPRYTTKSQRQSPKLQTSRLLRFQPSILGRN